MNIMKHVMNKTNSIRSACMQKARYFFMLVAFSVCTSVCFAQEDPGGGGLAGPGGDIDAGNPDEANVPFDGGVGFLVAAVIVYGVKKTYDSRRNRVFIEELNTL